MFSRKSVTAATAALTAHTSTQIKVQNVSFGYLTLVGIPMKCSAQFDLYNCLLLYMYKRYSADDIRKNTEALKLINTKRIDVVNSSYSSSPIKEETITSFEEYLRMLCVIETRFQINLGHLKTLEIEYLRDLKFAWTDALKPPTPQQSENLRTNFTNSSLSDVVVHNNTADFEKVCVLYNYAAALANYAKDQNTLSEIGLKQALAAYQKAWGVFEHIRSEWSEKGKVPGRKTFDFLTDTLSLFSIIMAVQAQCCFLELANLKGSKKSLLASIAIQASNYYKEAARLCAIPDLAALLPGEWINYFNFNEIYYRYRAECEAAAAAHAKAEEETEGYGEEVFRLYKAAYECDQANKLAKKKKLPYNLDELAKQSIEERDRAEKKNKEVYLDAVPSDVEAIEPRIVVKATPVDLTLVTPVPPGSDQTNNPYFQDLLPPDLRDFDNEFKSESTKIVNSANDSVTKCLSGIRSKLTSSGLPASIESNAAAPNTLPSSVWDQITSQVHSVGGINVVLDAPKKNEITSQTLERRLIVVEDSINKEQQVDGAFFASRNSAANYEVPLFMTVFRDIRDDIAHYKRLLVEARESDKGIAGLIAQSRDSLSLLALPLRDLNAMLPAVSNKLEPAVEKIRSELYQMYVELGNKMKELEDTLAKLTDLIKKVNGVNKLIKGNPNYSEVLNDRDQRKEFIAATLKPYKDLADKFSEKMNLLQFQLEGVLAKNQDFSRARTQTKETKAREEFIARIYETIRNFEVLFGHVRQGQDFYFSMSDYIDKIEGTTKDLMLIRKIQRDDIAGAQVSQLGRTLFNSALNQQNQQGGASGW